MKKVIEFFKTEKELINNNKNEVANSNRKLFYPLMACGIFILSVMVVVSLFVPAYKILLSGYLIVLAIIAITFVILNFVKVNHQIYVYYSLCFVVALYAAYSSAFVTPDFVGVLILLYLLIIPIMILDLSVRVILFDFFILALYLAIVLPHTNSNIFVDEIVNTFVFAVVGSVAGVFCRNSQLQKMELSRILNFERTTDFLTGLHNRRMLFEYFKNCLDGKEKVPYALAILDIDDFKSLNDSYGHAEGDKCLKRLGKCFKEFGEQNNIKFYRYGGEEFIALVNENSSEGLKNVFDRLNKSIREMEIENKKSKTGMFGVSIGITEINEVKSLNDFENRIIKADIAMYNVKNTEKGKILFYKDDMKI